MKLPSLRQIQYFLAVFDTKSFSAAAKQCHVTQSTLSAGLSEFEDIIGQRLFDRGTRHVDSTATGREIEPVARAILEQSTHLVHMASQRRAPLSGQLHMGVIPTIAPYLLPRFLPALQRDYPNLKLSLREDISARQLQELQRGNIDVVLMALPYPSEKTEHLTLWKEPFYIARQTSGTSKNFAPFSVDHLKKETVLLLDDGHCLRDHIMAACRIAPDTTREKNLGATSLQTLLQMVRHGYGITLVPAMAAQGEYLDRGLTLQPFTSPAPTRQIALVWRKNDARIKEFRLLGDFIKSYRPQNP